LRFIDPGEVSNRSSPAAASSAGMRLDPDGSTSPGSEASPPSPNPAAPFRYLSPPAPPPYSSAPAPPPYVPAPVHRPPVNLRNILPPFRLEARALMAHTHPNKTLPRQIRHKTSILLPLLLRLVS
jgi:hypothetical protein